MELLAIQLSEQTTLAKTLVIAMTGLISVYLVILQRLLLITEQLDANMMLTSVFRQKNFQ
jgi:hypothetical protein